MIISELDFSVFSPMDRDNSIKEINSYNKCAKKMDIVHVDGKVIYHTEVRKKDFEALKKECKNSERNF